MLTSTALVVLVRPVTEYDDRGVHRDSDPVLSRCAAQHQSGHVARRAARRSSGQSLTSYIISVSARGKTAAQAQATANAVANSYIAYVGSLRAPRRACVGRSASSQRRLRTGTSPLKEQITSDCLVLLFGALIGVIVALAIGRKDRRLRERDEIANSIGIPVLASVPVGHPSDAGWLDEAPGGLQARSRGRLAAAQGSAAAGMAGDNLDNGALHIGYDSRSSSLTVLSLSSDPGALALGPQLAVFAASSGIPTALVIGPQQDENVTAALRTACAMQPPASSKRPRHLQVTVSDGGDTGWALVPRSLWSSRSSTAGTRRCLRRCARLRRC